MLAVKNYTILDDGINREEKSKILRGNRKCRFWEIVINGQRPKIRVHINDIVTEGLLDTAADLPISYFRILASKLASSRDKCSLPRNWKSISSETKHEMG